MGLDLDWRDKMTIGEQALDRLRHQLAVALSTANERIWALEKELAEYKNQNEIFKNTTR